MREQSDHESGLSVVHALTDIIPLTPLIRDIPMPPSRAVISNQASIRPVGRAAMIAFISNLFVTSCAAALDQPLVESAAITAGVLRILPYPFARVLTVADDVDASRWAADEAMKDELRTRFGLDWGRSTLVNG